MAGHTSSELNTALENIRKVFGSDFQPADIFKQRGLLEKGVFGATRTEGSFDVSLIGPGGFTLGKSATPEQLARFGITAGASGLEQFKQLFGTDVQEGIVGSITREQATALSVKTTAPPPTPKVETAIVPKSTISSKGEFIKVAGTDQRFLISPEGKVEGFGTAQEFEQAGGIFGQETSKTGVEFRAIAEAGGVPEKAIAVVVGPKEEQTPTAEDIQNVTKHKSAAESLLELEQAISNALGISFEAEDV